MPQVSALEPQSSCTASPAPGIVDSPSHDDGSARMASPLLSPTNAQLRPAPVSPGGMLASPAAHQPSQPARPAVDAQRTESGAESFEAALQCEGPPTLRHGGPFAVASAAASAATAAAATSPTIGATTASTTAAAIEGFAVPVLDRAQSLHPVVITSGVGLPAGCDLYQKYTSASLPEQLAPLKRLSSDAGFSSSVPSQRSRSMPIGAARPTHPSCVTPMYGSPATCPGVRSSKSPALHLATSRPCQARLLPDVQPLHISWYVIMYAMFEQRSEVSSLHTSIRTLKRGSYCVLRYGYGKRPRHGRELSHVQLQLLRRCPPALASRNDPSRSQA